MILFLNRQKLPIKKNNLTRNDLIDSEIKLINVSFAYSKDEAPLLNHINLHIKPRECIAITGASGSGKTTLLKIMMGLLPPTEGKIIINSRDLYLSNLQVYRQNIASVLQTDILLMGTIKENIIFFAVNVDVDRLHICAELAGIKEEINSFPMQFDTLVGDMGCILSGGQKQRILLARALYANPVFLFLDEATSHLDVKKEREVNAALRSLGITIVMVAHRQETIKMADRVFQL